MSPDRALQMISIRADGLCGLVGRVLDRGFCDSFDSGIVFSLFIVV